jgi:hypothetical protein
MKRDYFRLAEAVASFANNKVRLPKLQHSWRKNTRHNDTQHNDTRYNDAQHNDAQHNDI